MLQQAATRTAAVRGSGFVMELAFLL